MAGAFVCCNCRNKAHMVSHWHIFGGIFTDFNEFQRLSIIIIILFLLWLSLSSRDKSQSLLPVRLFVLPPILLFDNCSLRQSRSSFWLVLSLSFLLPPSRLHPGFLTILIPIVCSLVTLWCTWLWCGLRDGGNYHRVGGGMPLSLHLLHGDKPQPRVQQGDSIQHSFHSTPTITHRSELCIWGLFKLTETYLNFKSTIPAAPAKASLGVRTDGTGWIFCNLGTKRCILSPLMKKWTRKGSSRFVVNCSLLGMRLLWIEMNSPFTFTPTTTSTTYMSRRGEVYTENNSVHMKNLPFSVGDILRLFFLFYISAYKVKTVQGSFGKFCQIGYLSSDR